MRGVRGKASFIANIDLAFNAKTMQCEINNVLGTWSQKQRHIRYNVFFSYIRHCKARNREESDSDGEREKGRQVEREMKGEKGKDNNAYHTCFIMVNYRKNNDNNNNRNIINQ